MDSNTNDTVEYAQGFADRGEEIFRAIDSLANRLAGAERDAEKLLELIEEDIPGNQFQLKGVPHVLNMLNALLFVERGNWKGYSAARVARVERARKLIEERDNA